MAVKPAKPGRRMWTRLVAEWFNADDPAGVAAL